MITINPRSGKLLKVYGNHLEMVFVLLYETSDHFFNFTDIVHRIIGSSIGWRVKGTLNKLEKINFIIEKVISPKDIEYDMFYAYVQNT